jgi:hypothetical protein
MVQPHYPIISFMKKLFLSLFLVSSACFSQTYTLKISTKNADTKLKINNIDVVDIGEIKRPEDQLNMTEHQLNITELVNTLGEDRVYKPNFSIEVQNKQSTNCSNEVHKQLLCMIKVLKDNKTIAQHMQNIIYTKEDFRTNVNCFTVFVDK